MTIMSAIKFWYMEVIGSVGFGYEKWVNDMANTSGWDKGGIVQIGFFCLDDMSPFE